MGCSKYGNFEKRIICPNLKGINFSFPLYFPKNVRIGFPYSSIQYSFCFALFFFCFVWMNCFLYSSKVSELFFKKCCFHVHQNHIWHQKKFVIFGQNFERSKIFFFFLIVYFLTCNSHSSPLPYFEQFIIWEYIRCTCISFNSMLHF